MLQILLPAWTVCLDLFFTAIAYGISGIRIPVRAACILSGTGAGCFLAAMELANGRGCFCLHRSASWLVWCYWQLWGEQCY